MRTKSPETLKAIFNYYESYYAKNNCSPAVSNVQKKIGISPSTAHGYIKVLVEDGRLEQIDTRGYIPISTKVTSSDNIPQIGSISCGIAITAEENIERYITVPKWFCKTRQKYFFLKASGDSMVGAGISDGDLVLIRQQETAEEGNIVVALTPEKESTLKTLKLDHESGKVILHPENKKYKDMLFPYIEIQGVVEKVIKEYD